MYGKWLYKEIKTEYGQCKVEIFRKGYTATAIEIGGFVSNSLNLALENLSSITDPIGKSVCSFEIYDTEQIEYDDLFSPDATAFKVVVSTKVDGGEYVTRWSGYVTPDFFAENLSYRTPISISARDNIGYLNDVDFDLEASTITVRELIQAAFNRIAEDYPMQLVFAGQKQTAEGVLAIDATISTMLFQEGTWYEAIETVLHDLAMQLRWVDNNTIAVVDVSQIPDYYIPQSFNFIDGSGYREILPAWRELSQQQDYGVRENFFDGWLSEKNLTFVKDEVVANPLGTDTSVIKYYSPNNWQISGNTYTINLSNYSSISRIDGFTLQNLSGTYREFPTSGFGERIFFTGTKKENTDYGNYMSYRMPIYASSSPLKISFAALNTVLTPEGVDLHIYNPIDSKIFADSAVGVLQLGIKMNVLLHIGTNTYILKDNWELLTSPETDSLTFVLDPVGGIEPYYLAVDYDKEQEITIDIHSIPTNGDIELRIYGYFINDSKYINTEDDKWLRYISYINKVCYSFDVQGETGKSSNIGISELHNIKTTYDCIIGQVIDSHGGINAFAGGLYDANNGMNPMQGFRRNADGNVYHLTELIGREITHFNKKNYNKLSGTIKNLSKEPLMFNRLFAYNGKNYAPYACSLDVISNTMNITTMQEVEPYITHSFVEIKSELVTGGGATVSGGNNTALQYSAEVGNAKRISELNNASESEKKESYIIVDNASWNESKKVPLSEMKGLNEAELTEFLTANKYATQPWVSGIAKGLADDIANRVLIADFEKLEGTVNGNYQSINILNGKVGTLEGYFTNGVANDSAKLGGQLPLYYATSSALATVSDNLSALTTRVSNAEGAITTIQNNYVDKGSAQTITGVKTFSNGLKIGDIKLEWDSTNQALKIVGNAYVTELFSVGKISESGSGGGGTASAAVRIILGETPYDAVNGVVNLPAYPSLNGYATEAWVNNKGYLTSVSWGDVNGKPTTLSGYGITDAFFLHPTLTYLGVRFANGEYATGDKYLEWWNSAGWVNHMSAKYIVVGGTSSHFLKGDGSLDSVAYLPISGGTINGTLRIENAHASLNLIRTGGDSGFITYLGGSDWRVTNHQWQKEYVLWHTGNLDPSAFLPLTGGTMDGNLKINAKNYLGLAVNSPDNNLNQLQLQVNGTLKGMLQYNSNFGFGFHYEGFGGLYIKGDGTPIYVDSNTTRCALIHSGNIAEQLDSRYFRTRYESIPTDKDLATLAAGSYLVYENTGLSNKVPSTYSSLVVLGKSYYAPQLSVVHNASRAWLRGVYNTETPSVSEWHELAFIDSVVSGAGYAERLSKTWREDPNYTSSSNLKLISNPTSTQGNYASGYSSGLSVMTDYVGWQMMSYGGDVQNPYFRSYQDNGTWKPWRQLAFLDDNVASADYATNAGKLGGYDAGAYPTFEEGSNYIAFNLRSNYTAKGQGNGYIEFYDNDWYNCAWGKVTAVYELKTPSVTTSGALQYSAPSGHNFLGGDVTIGNLTNDGQKLLVDGSVGLRGITEITYNHRLGSTGWNWYTVYSSNTGNDGDIVNIRLSHSYWYLGTDSVELKIAIGYYNCKIIQTIYNFGGSGAFSSVRVRRVGSTHYIDVYMYNSVAATDRFFVSGSGKGTFQAPTLCTTDEGLIDSLGLAVGQSRLQDTYIVGNLTATGGATFGGDVTSEGTIAMAKLASSSDRKLKENIKWLSVDRVMEVVRALRPTEWNWKKDHTHSFGFIAQDVQPIVPEMVSSINDTLRLEYNQLHAFEIGAIQHIDSEVEILKRRVTELENELNKYRRTAQWQ